MIYHIAQCRDAPIVHIGCCDGHITQRRSLEPPDVGGILRKFVNARVVAGVREFSLDVVQAIVVKLDFGETFVEVINRSREIESAVTMEAFRSLRIEKGFTTFSGGTNGFGILQLACLRWQEPAVADMRFRQRDIERKNAK